MGNIISDQNNQYKIREDTVLGKEVKKIFHEQIQENKNKVSYFADANRNTNIKINQLKACCVGAVSTNPAKTLGLPLPSIPDTIKNVQTDCKMNGTSCLETVYVGYTIKLNNDSERGQYCGLSMDDKSIDDLAKSCDKLMLDSCAKEIYNQGCIILTNEKNPNTGKRRAIWNVKNPLCTRTEKGNPVLFSGSPACNCTNSMFGPNLNTEPSRDIEKTPSADKNPYALSTSQYEVDFDGDNQNTVYSLNIFKRDTGEQYPGFLDSSCIKTKENSWNTAYNLVRDRNQKSLTICIANLNLTDSQIGKAYLENNTFQNNCGNVGGGGGTKPAITDAEDERLEQVRLAEERAQLAKIEQDRIAKEEQVQRDLAEKERIVLEEARLKQQKEEEELKKREADRLIKLEEEQKGKYPDEIAKQEAVNKSNEEEKTNITQEVIDKQKAIEEEKITKENKIKEEILIAEIIKKMLIEQETKDAENKRILNELEAKRKADAVKAEELEIIIKKQKEDELKMKKDLADKQAKDLADKQAKDLADKQAKEKADVQAKDLADKLAKTIAIAKQEENERTERNKNYTIAGTVIGILLIALVLFLMVKPKSKSKKYSDSDDDDE